MKEKETDQKTSKENEDSKISENKAKEPEIDEKIKNLEEELKEKSNELEKSRKDAEDWKSKANSYLNTASYYKNQAEEAKKDFDRYKERNKNIEKDAILNANQITAKKILPIIDDFNHAMQTVSPELLRGFVMIYSSLTDILKEIGVNEISCKDEKLDPEKHNCIETIETEDENLDGVIAKVYQKGYWFADLKKVVRPANVSVYKFSKKEDK